MKKIIYDTTLSMSFDYNEEKEEFSIGFVDKDGHKHLQQIESKNLMKILVRHFWGYNW